MRKKFNNRRKRRFNSNNETQKHNKNNNNRRVNFKKGKEEGVVKEAREVDISELKKRFITVLRNTRNRKNRRDKLREIKREITKEKFRQSREKKKEKEELIKKGIPLPEPVLPKTLEEKRIPDETIIRKDEEDEEIIMDEQDDEFSKYFKDKKTPKVLMTTCYKPKSKVEKFIKELLDVFPIAIYYHRRNFNLKEIVSYANNEDFSDIIVFNQNHKSVNYMHIIHLPEGPTSIFRLRNLKLSTEIKNAADPTGHKPELILNNFDTRLGHRVARQLASLFPADPQFRGRQVVTFHNQRDFIFFRHHRYVFREVRKKNASGKIIGKLKARLQELGPRFYMQLISIQKGAFDTIYGEYEWNESGEIRKEKKLLVM